MHRRPRRGRCRHTEGRRIRSHVRDRRRAARNVGPTQQIRVPARRGEGGGDVVTEAVDVAERGDARPVGRRYEGHEVESAADRRFETVGVAEQEGPDERAHHRAEAQPGLGHR